MAARSLGVDIDAIRAWRRPLIRYCLDWSEQRHHVAGAPGATVPRARFERGLLKAAPNSWAVLVTEDGERVLKTRASLAVNGQR